MGRKEEKIKDLIGDMIERKESNREEVNVEMRCEV